jgi:hypothetical protein
MRPLSKSQATCLTIMTGSLLLKAEDFRKEVEKKLGREINAVEFANDEFVAELQELYREDFKQLLDVVEDSGLVLFK